MKHKKIIALIICFLFVNAFSSASAAPKIKKGAWLMTTRIIGLPFPMPPRQANFCPEPSHPAPKKEHYDSDCDLKWDAKSGNTVKWTVKCNNGMLITAEITYAWDTMKGTQEIVSAAGESMISEISGKWIGPNCH
jgi:hypothetical protein